ncbi:MAG: RluA family pseudouridine synthase [Bacilli bacterium]
MKDTNKITVRKSQELFSFLEEQFPEYSHKKIKLLLAHHSVLVNKVITTQFNQELEKGQIVEIKDAKFYGKINDNRLVILMEDNDLIAVSKPAGLLSVSTEKEKNKTMFHIVSNYVKQANPNNKIFVVHRLDKDTSGVLVFAKNETAKHKLQDHWEELVKKRVYLAIVEGNVPTDKGTIKSYFKETETFRVYSTDDRVNGKLAITHYKKLKETKDYTWLEVSLETGRKNQIRVHMQDMKTPIVGDKKYGSTKDPLHRLGLHAHILELVHPKTNQLIKIVAPIPTILK